MSSLEFMAARVVAREASMATFLIGGECVGEGVEGETACDIACLLEFLTIGAECKQTDCVS